MSARVIALENDPAIAHLYRDLLSEHNYEVTTLSQPIDDPGVFATFQADLIILELLIYGDLVGPHIIEQLKTHPATATIPVVVCTSALDLLPQLEPVLATYNVPVIPKPFHIDQFLGVIQHALSEQSMRAMRP